MPGPFSPSDDIIGPISHQIAILIAAQIPSIATVYERLTDRPPGDNTVTISLLGGRVKEETNGKIRVMYTFTMRHLFRRANIADSTSQAYLYVTPWLKFLAAWPNQSLGLTFVREVNPSELRILQIPQSGQPMVALIISFDVLTEFNIPLT